MYRSGTINSFNEIDLHVFKGKLATQIKEEIYGRSKDYILTIDELEYVEYLKDFYCLQPLKIHDESETAEEPKVEKEIAQDPIFKHQYEVDYYVFTVEYSFEGSPILFRVRPTPWAMTSYKITVNEYSNTVAFKFKVSNKSVEEYNRKKSDAYNCAFKNIENINKNLSGINSDILSNINQYFYRRKEELKKENDFFAAINIKVNDRTKSIFTVPTIKKKDLPQPTTSSRKEFTSEPSMSQNTYDDILEVIYNLGKGMERKPSLYQGKDEEQIRDYFVMFLETRYEATTATGETFNRDGKTDIILKYAEDGRNLFVAECKFWHGSSEFLKAISQLFDRYLTWRDSKTALILFSKNKDFTSVLNTIKTDIKTHPNYLKENGTRGDSSFSYIFCLSQDNHKEVFFEVIVFHFDK